MQAAAVTALRHAAVVLPPASRAVARMRLQYASDLHLEVHPTPAFASLLRPVAPYLALCGNIGRADKPEELRAFLGWCAARWQRVFYVAGNHEHWGEDADRWAQHPPVPAATVPAALRAIAAPFPNVTVLDREAQFLPEHNVAVLGATLWSAVAPAEVHEAVTYVRDYQRISREGPDGLLQRVGPAETTAWHVRDAAWLDAAIAEWGARGAAVVVLTHHLPTPQLTPVRYRGLPLNSCFATDCSHLLRAPVKAWLCGHSHGAVTLTAGEGVLCSLNARGYPGGEAPVPGYCDRLFVDVAGPDAEALARLEAEGPDPLLQAAAAGLLAYEEMEQDAARAVSLRAAQQDAEELEWR